MIRSLFLAIIVISCSPYPALGASPRTEAELDKWLEELSHPDPFTSKQAEAEVRNRLVYRLNRPVGPCKSWAMRCKDFPQEVS